ncbi:MAG TPA: TIR domain-containing protein [Nitrosomonas sp.]|nr:TIR domain-containing protein [Chitinophagales bacterium]HMW21391.1 TIR domain-containing protein [Nitrosomonas sp.]HMW69262.1 TIR domain-containing protein [Nitrosomonas sp.]HMY62343.1 TIR domain-containing protein [Nitrosomonas sp.]HMY90930.1 TIR domain-containing protein [Nitrosomonas sp.]
MADIFLSYASSNRTNAETLAIVIQKLGWTVWWDRQIPIGLTYDEVIEKNLKAAKCVIVLWTKASAASDWVKNEASEGAKRKILIPILLENIEIPLEFRRNQTAKLIDWRSATQYHPEFPKLYTRLTELLGHPRYSPEGPPFKEFNHQPSIVIEAPPPPPWRKFFIVAAVILSLVVIVPPLVNIVNPPPTTSSSAQIDELPPLNMSAEQSYQKGKQLFDSKKYKEAFIWLEAAAHQDHIGAINKVIEMYSDGKGVDENYGKVAEWVEKKSFLHKE